MRRALPTWALLGLFACATESVRDGFDGSPESPEGTADASTPDDAGPGIGRDDSGRDGSSTTDPGAIDLDAIAPCDDGLAVDGDADAFARAIGLCQRASESGPEWGLLEVDFRHHVGTNPAPAAAQQHGILPRFGSVLVPREGTRLGVLSTGFAREYDSENGQAPFDEGTGFGVGVGEVPEAFGGRDTDAYDLINARMRIRVPSNAHGIAFDFNFHTGEWPSYVRSEFNDRFIVWMTDAAHPEGHNLSFDAQNNPVTVNLGFFDRCVPGAVTGCAGDRPVQTATCAGGPGELAGTGFGLMNQGCGSAQNDITRGGATGWLTTAAEVVGGEVVTIEFAIWDQYDANRDSLVLLDNFRWAATPVTPGTSRPPN